MILICILQYQLYLLIQVQVGIQQEQTQIYLQQAELLSNKLTNLENVISLQKSTDASNMVYFQGFILLSVGLVVFLILFRPDASDAQIEFLSNNFKQLSKENTILLDKLDDITRLSLEKAESKVLTILPNDQTLQIVDDLMKDVFHY